MNRLTTTGKDATVKTAEQHDRDKGIIRKEYSVISDGGSLYVREVCPITPVNNAYVIFVHGLTFPSSVDFDLPQPNYSVTEYLAKQGINCCIFDIRGYGRSYKPGYGEPVGMAERARDLAAVCQFLKEKYSTNKITLIGLSNGCNTIVEFLKTTQELPHSIIFIGPSYLLNHAMVAVLRRAQFLRFLQSLIGRKENVYASLGRGLLRSRLYRGEEELIDQDVFEQFVTLSINASSPGAKRLRAPVLSFPDPRRSWHKWDPLFDAERITCPLLIVRGDGDEFCCQRTAETLVKNVPTKRVQFITFKNRKHDIHLYKEHEDFFEEIYTFIVSQEGVSA